ncbi:hypothetical protein [Streptomyces sp. NPDC037389]|uniref:hypothetical protein n=1 Tax=Streptomyces sp. NPDC037389 TaxID=3155369 RepID=UPI0034054DF3
MLAEDTALAVKHWRDCTDVYDFLEQVRLRPGMWLHGGSLHHLQAILIGYQVAATVHSVDDPCDFWHGGGFSQWLGNHFDGTSPLGWASDIERNTPEGSTPVQEFFRLLDAYRQDTAAEVTVGGLPEEP